MSINKVASPADDLQGQKDLDDKGYHIEKNLPRINIVEMVLNGIISNTEG